jgi:hypothetical protein
MIERLNRNAGIAALFVALLALVLAVTVPAMAEKGRAAKKPAKRPGQVVRLVKGKVPARQLPVVPRAKRADRLGAEGATAETLTTSCAPETVDLGTWCLSSSLYPLADDEVGKNDYLFATQKCVELGGWLPTAAQLVGAAPRVKLAGTIDDSRLTATVDLDATDGLKDRREMSSTLVTTAAGASSAGSLGVTEGSKGDPKTGEPDPVPLPANPLPETLQYVTVYDNRDKGGFAGSKAVSQPESFRCAFSKTEGAAQAEVG